MADFQKILDQLVQSGAASGFAGGLAGGVAGSLLAGKSGRKLGKKALKYGGMAAIAAIAYTAYKNYSAGKNGGAAAPGTPAASPPLLEAPAGSPFLPASGNASAQADLNHTLVRAMIAAARADKRLDSEESQAIFGRIQSLDLSADDKADLIDEMNHPVDMDEIVRSATCPEVAAEIYTASLLAIDVDTPAEDTYLAMLAARLKLPRELVAELHRHVESQQEPVA